MKHRSRRYTLCFAVCARRWLVYAAAAVACQLTATSSTRRRLPSPRVRLRPEQIFFAVEGEDNTLTKDDKAHLRDLCTTWLSHIPWGRAVVFSDNYIEMPPECREIGLNEVVPCCPGNTSLGDSIATAQLKRENLHLHLPPRLPPDVRWIVSTEQDVWWGLQELWTYLALIEMQYSDLDLDSVPAFVGPIGLGPFVVFNRAWLEQFFGNSTFMDQCRHSMLFGYGPGGWKRLQFKKDGAVYNNDDIMMHCVRVARRGADAARQQILFFDRPAARHAGVERGTSIETVPLTLGMHFNADTEGARRERPRDLLDLKWGSYTSGGRGTDFIAWHHVTGDDMRDLELYTRRGSVAADWRLFRYYEPLLDVINSSFFYGCYDHRDSELHRGLGSWVGIQESSDAPPLEWSRLSCVADLVVDDKTLSRIRQDVRVWTEAFN